MENCVEHTVLIIGAGPAGLALSYWLQQSSIDYLMLEKSAFAGSSWRQMPDQLHLISMWPSNCLIHEDRALFPATMTHKAPEFSDYLEDFSEKYRLKIKFQQNVVNITKQEMDFLVKTDSQNFKAKFVVDCRGYFNHPYTPHFEIEGTPPLMVHFKDYKNAAQFDQYKKIMVVGKRLSAGQVLGEIAATKKHDIYLSSRSEIKFSSHPFVYNFFLRHLDFIESIIKKLKLRMKDEIEVPMHHKAKKIVEENVKVVGVISKISNKTVHFTDGTSLELDAIIFTTGFKPPEVQLKNDFESSATENLYYLGRGSQRSFTSRFLRGIRDDAPVLANLISGKIAFKNNRQ